MESLCAFTGVQFTPTGWFIEDQAGHARVGGSVDVRGKVSGALRLEAPVMENRIGQVGLSCSNCRMGSLLAHCRTDFPLASFSAVLTPLSINVRMICCCADFALSAPLPPRPVF